jgi:hypothetical protein
MVNLRMETNSHSMIFKHTLIKIIIIINSRKKYYCLKKYIVYSTHYGTYMDILVFCAQETQPLGKEILYGNIRL